MFSENISSENARIQLVNGKKFSKKYKSLPPKAPRTFLKPCHVPRSSIEQENTTVNHGHPTRSDSMYHKFKNIEIPFNQDGFWQIYQRTQPLAWNQNKEKKSFG